MYLTYPEYQGIGGNLTEVAFNRYIFRAEGIINNYTHNRVSAMSNVPEAAKQLTRDLVEYIANNGNENSILASKSQSVGNVSQSESYTTKTQQDHENIIYTMVLDYLINVADDQGMPLLYRGV